MGKEQGENELKAKKELNELKAKQEKEKAELKNENLSNGDEDEPMNNPKKEKKKEVKPTKKSKPAPIEEDVYNVEALIEKKGSKYLIKWKNYDNNEDNNTWEPVNNIVDGYQDLIDVYEVQIISKE